jgi:hypothetical protein
MEKIKIKNPIINKCRVKPKGGGNLKIRGA